MIIGIVGPKGSGKSTLAGLLVRRGFTRLSFAGPLKSMIRALLREQGASAETITRMVDGDLKEVGTSLLGGRSPRYAMQTLGTEWGRELIGHGFWLDSWATRAAAIDDVACDDVRFLNEAERIRDLGGVVVRVVRDLSTAVDSHVSETELSMIHPDHAVTNPPDVPEGMLTQLAAKGLLR